MDVMENVIPRYFVFDSGLNSLTDAVLTWVYSLGQWDCRWIVSQGSTWLFLPHGSYSVSQGTSGRILPATLFI